MKIVKINNDNGYSHDNYEVHISDNGLKVYRNDRFIGERSLLNICFMFERMF